MRLVPQEVCLENEAGLNKGRAVGYGLQAFTVPRGTHVLKGQHLTDCGCFKSWSLGVENMSPEARGPKSTERFCTVCFENMGILRSKVLSAMATETLQQLGALRGIMLWCCKFGKRPLFVSVVEMLCCVLVERSGYSKLVES